MTVNFFAFSRQTLSKRNGMVFQLPPLCSDRMPALRPQAKTRPGHGAGLEWLA
jgi:hypothetical protein